MPDIAMTQTDLRGRDCNDHKMKLSDLKFESNNGAMEPSELAWLPRYDAKSSLEDIRRELETRGVVHIRGLVPRETVLGARRQLTARWFEHMAPCGLLKEGTDPVEGIYCGDPDTTRFPIPDHVVHFPGIPKDNMHLNLVEEATTSDWINAFADNKDLLEYVKQLKSDWADPFLFKRRLYRANLPFAKGTSTGVHYDQIFLRGGPPTTLTAWIPIGDCNPMQGGLMYLEDSMMIGEQQERAFDAMCGEKEMTDAQRTNAFNANMASAGMLSTDAGAFSRALGGGRKWLIGDFEAGDVVFHHSYMIHASGRNVDPEMRIRLSADLRFADREAPYDERWNQRWRIDDGL